MVKNMSPDAVHCDSPVDSNTSNSRTARLRINCEGSNIPSLQVEEKFTALLSEEEKTPSSDRVSTPRAPPAPTKSASPFHSRAHPSPAVRSLTTIFNGCGGAAERARQMGGQYMKVRKTPPKQGGAGSPPDSSTAHAPKRFRSVLGELLQSPSVTTVCSNPLSTVDSAPVGDSLAPPPWDFKSPPAFPKPGAPPLISPALAHPTPFNPQPRPVATAMAGASPLAAQEEAAECEWDAMDEDRHSPCGQSQDQRSLAAGKGEEAATAQLPRGAVRRAVGRPVGHGEVQRSVWGREEGGSRSEQYGWMKSAAFKPR